MWTRSGETLREELSLEWADGRRRTVFKTFRMSHDYLRPLRKDRVDHSPASTTTTAGPTTTTVALPRLADGIGSFQAGLQEGSWTWQWDEAAGKYVKDYGTSQASSGTSAVSDQSHSGWVRFQTLSAMC